MVVTPEEIVEAGKKLIGQETEPVPGRYPVEYEPIRRYCHMMEDDNPLFLDPEYAKKTKYGEVVAPPFMAQLFGGPGPWPPMTEAASFFRQIPTTPGSSFIVLSTDWEFFKPIKVGERISAKNRFTDIYLKGIRLDPKARWMVMDNIYLNQDGEEVALARMTALAIRSPEEVKAAGDAQEEKK